MLSLQVNSKLPFERLSSFEMVLFLIILALISVSVIIYCINEVQLAPIDDTLRKVLAEMTQLRRFEYYLFVYLPFKRNPCRNSLTIINIFPFYHEIIPSYIPSLSSSISKPLRCSKKVSKEPTIGMNRKLLKVARFDAMYWPTYAQPRASLRNINRGVERPIGKHPPLVFCKFQQNPHGRYI